MNFIKTRSNYKGVTLISLIITIIVMLILIGITLTVALNGGLIAKAQEAKIKTEKAMADEETLEMISIDGTSYNSIDEYLEGSQSQEEPEESKIHIIKSSSSFIGLQLNNDVIQEKTVSAETSEPNDTITWKVEDPSIAQITNTSGSETIIQATSPGRTNLIASARWGF